MADKTKDSARELLGRYRNILIVLSRNGDWYGSDVADIRQEIAAVDCVIAEFDESSGD